MQYAYTLYVTFIAWHYSLLTMKLLPKQPIIHTMGHKVV